MKLTYVSLARIPSERAHAYQILQMCQGFLTAGAEVSLVSPKRREADRRGALHEHYGLRREVPIIHLPCLDLLPEATASPIAGPQLEQLAFALLRQQFLARASHYLRAEHEAGRGSDIIFTRDVTVARAVRGLAPRGVSSEVLVEVHKLAEDDAKLQVEAERLKVATGIVVVTQAMRQRLLSQGFAPERVLWEPDAVDLETFSTSLTRLEARRKLGLPLKGKIASYVGRLETMGKGKGVDILIGSAREFLQRPDTYLMIVGATAAEQAQCRKDVAAAGIPADRVILVDFRPVTELPAYLAASDVLVSPMPWTHHFAYNASPLKLFQYMSSGRPIVATDLPSAREILVDGASALLPEPDSAPALAAAIRRVFADEDLARRLGTAAAAKVQAYSWTKRAERILAWSDDLRAAA